MITKFHQVSELESLVERLDSAEVRPISINNKETQDYVAIWNTTKNELEGVTKKSYSNLIQHKNIFLPFINAIKSTPELEVKGSVRNFGGRVIVENLFSNLTIKDSEGEIQLGVRLENSYNGGYFSSPSFRAEGFGVREYCDNGMFLGKTLMNSLTSKHLLKSDLEKILLEFISNMFSRSELLEKKIEEEEKVLIPSLADVQSILVGEVAGQKTCEKIIDLIEKPDKITKYDLYNSITNYATHYSKNEIQKRNLQNKAQRILTVAIPNLRRGVWKRKEENIS